MNKSELIRLISQNKIKECIDALFSDKDDALIEYQDTLINLSRRYTEYESKRINRTEHSDKLEVEINLISSDLLQLIKLTKSEQSDTISNEEDKETEQKNEINDRSKDQTKNIKEEKVEKNKGLKGWLQFVSSKITGKDNLELADLLWLILFAFFVVFTMIVFMSKIQGDISSVLKNIIYAMCTIIFISLSFKYLVFSPLKWVNIIFKILFPILFLAIMGFQILGISITRFDILSIMPPQQSGINCIEQMEKVNFKIKIIVPPRKLLKTLTIYNIPSEWNNIYIRKILVNGNEVTPKKCEQNTACRTITYSTCKGCKDIIVIKNDKDTFSETVNSDINEITIK